MKEVYILLRRIHDPYGCLEDNDTDIVGIFDNLELAEQNQKQKQQRNKEHQKEYMREYRARKKAEKMAQTV